MNANWRAVNNDRQSVKTSCEKLLIRFHEGYPIKVFLTFFFNCYLAALRAPLDHYRGGSLAHPMLITCVLHIRPEGHWEPRNEVGSLSPAKCLVGFKPGTFPI